MNDFAPEHLEILVSSPFDALAEINNAGEILIGKNTPITAGNYCLGIDAILPTGGFARSYSGVSVFDFLKRSSVAYATEKGFDSIAGTALTLAEYEGFPAHARAISESPGSSDFIPCQTLKIIEGATTSAPPRIAAESFKPSHK